MLNPEATSTFAGESENPFAEATLETPAPPAAIGFAPWNENESPFLANLDESAPQGENEELVAEVYAELRDEGFDEALAFLTEETEQAVSERFLGETPANAAERERFADAHVAPVRFEAEQYLDALEAGLTGMDVEALTEEQLDEVLERLDPKSPSLTPAGEEFIGKLVKKAKSVVKTVTNVAKSVGKVAGSLLGPVLKKLRGLISPLLKRVLSFAIGRLPAPLQPAARKLAATFISEAESEELDEAPVSPANLTDLEMLAESFDAALAEAVSPHAEAEEEALGPIEEAEVDSRELELLAEARGHLMDQLQNSGDGETLAPAIEQFVPALLGALRLGINLVGRPKVVGFLANYLAQLIGRWTGPQMAGPLSNAIVDTGLRLISLEAENGTHGERTDEVAPAALASVIEDTVRSLAENEDYVFEDEELTQIAAAEAFSRAVATNFPPSYVRPDIQQAPTLGGTFVSRRPRSIRPFRKYSRTPEVQITPQIANSLPTFGGSTVGATMRAAGARLPMRARMHIYQAVPGTTLPRMTRVDRGTAAGPRSHINTGNVHPLTPAAAGILLREPALGVPVPGSFLRTRNRIAAGQRFYILVPVDGSAAVSQVGVPGRAATARLAPSRAWTSVNLRKGRVTVGLYLSEAEAQRVVEAIRTGQGGLALLKALTGAYQEMERLSSSGMAPAQIQREDGEQLEELEEFAFRGARSLPAGLKAVLRRQLRSWVMPALAKWVRTNAEAFARAAAHPEAGVTVRIRLTSVPGLGALAQQIRGRLGQAGAPPSLRGTPAITITVTPGRRRQ